jgi:hypothetical protein
MSIRKEVLSMIPSEVIGPSGQERLGLEQIGLKELCSKTDFMSTKRGGREPGVRKWGRG